MTEDQWHKVRSKIYYAEYRIGKVGEVVKCWFGNVELRDGQIIVKKPNGEISIAEGSDFFRSYELV